jgi:hypothetical protein
VRDISIGDRVMVAIPAPIDEGLRGRMTLRKPGGANGPRGRRAETPEETLTGIALGQDHAVQIPRSENLAHYFFTEEPQEAEVTPWLLRKINKGSLVMVDAPRGSEGEPVRVLMTAPIGCEE